MYVLKIKYAHVKCYYNLCNVCSFQRVIIRVIVRGVRCTILKRGILISISFVCLISARRNRWSIYSHQGWPVSMSHEFCFEKNVNYAMTSI